MISYEDIQNEFQFPKGTVLIVDDQQDNVRLLFDILKKEGYGVRIATSGASALTSMKRKPSDLVLLDILMPNMDGYEVCERLKQDKSLANIPVIFISALNETIDKVRSFAVGGVDFIHKPFQAEEVVARVNTHNNLHQLRCHLAKQNTLLKESQEKLESSLEDRTLQIYNINKELKEEIKERQRVEKELRESEERFRRIFDHASIGLCLLDGYRNIMLVNSTLSVSLGYSANELVQKKITDIVFKEDLSTLQDGINQLEKHQRKTFGAEINCYRKDRQLVPILMGCILLWDIEGKPMNFVIYMQDTSKIKSLQNQLRHAQKMEAIGTFSSGIAHDFNNILSIILGYADISRMNYITNNQPALECNSKIMQAGERAKQLIQQLLTFCRTSDQGLTDLKLSPLIKEIFQLLKSTISTSIELKLEIKTDSDIIRANPDLIYQISMNLSGNAAYAMQGSGGELIISLEDLIVNDQQLSEFQYLTNGEYVKLTFRDTGIGMSEQAQERAFEPYFTTKPVGEGTGLGLSVVHGIVKELKGDIRLKSQSGQGSIFELIFPKVKQISQEENHAVENNSIPTGQERILFVDDEPELAEINRRMLDKLGYEVHTETDSINALERFKKAPESFDVVIADLVMPKKMGDELAEEILVIRPDIPIIICSGFNEPRTEERLKKIGIRKMIMKPILMVELAVSLRNVIDQSNNVTPSNKIDPEWDFNQT